MYLREPRTTNHFTAVYKLPGEYVILRTLSNPNIQNSLTYPKCPFRGKGREAIKVGERYVTGCITSDTEHYYSSLDSSMSNTVIIKLFKSDVKRGPHT